MVTTKDIMELRKRLNKEDCSITRMCGCYVDNEKNKVTKLNERFLNLPEEEFYKYLEIAREILNKKIDDNMLSMEIKDIGVKNDMAAVVESELKQEEVLESAYDKIIETYGHVGNYLILFFHDAYDIPKVTKDNQKLDESEEVYEYIICAICPVTLTLPGIEYNEESKMFAPRERDWVVQKPESGFIYPAFEGRTAETGKVMFYTKDAKAPAHKFMEEFLGCEETFTATEIRGFFEEMIFNATQNKELSEDFESKISNGIFEIMLEPETENKAMDEEEMEELLKDVGIAPVYAGKIAEDYRKEFSPKYPKVAFLLNKKALKTYEESQRKKKLLDMMQKAAKEIVAYAGQETETVQEIEDMIRRNS